MIRVLPARPVLSCAWWRTFFAAVFVAILSCCAYTPDKEAICPSGCLYLANVKNWISILERTGIVYLLQPYSASALNRAIKTPKIYFRDTGLVCYLTRWLTADALKNSAVAGNIFETYVVSEILKSYSNEGKDYRFSIFYYRGKDKKAVGENEIDLIIEENGILYPVENKMSGNPKASMGATNPVLDKIPEKKRGTGIVLCLIDKKHI